MPIGQNSIFIILLKKIAINFDKINYFRIIKPFLLQRFKKRVFPNKCLQVHFIKPCPDPVDAFVVVWK